MNLAVAIGFHKARQFELALPYAETAAAKLDTPAAHLNFGDLLLTLAESQTDPNADGPRSSEPSPNTTSCSRLSPTRSRPSTTKPGSFTPTWTSPGRRSSWCSALQKRVSSAALPGEFYDTLGSIQESIGKIRDAEQAYTDGLKKSPEHPVLNFHFGKMIAGDRSRAVKALPVSEDERIGNAQPADEPGSHPARSAHRPQGKHPVKAGESTAGPEKTTISFAMASVIVVDSVQSAVEQRPKFSSENGASSGFSRGRVSIACAGADSPRA